VSTKNLKNGGYKMTNLKDDEIQKWNREQLELRRGLPNLYRSMLESKQGNSDYLDLHVLRKRKIELWNGKKRIHEYIILMDKRLNDYLIKLKQKYCDNNDYVFSVNYHNAKMGVKSSNKVFESEEIESMLINYVMSFPFGFVEVYEGFYVNVPEIKKFKGETDEHSNKKLVKYIMKSFEKQVLLKRLHKQKNVKRVMKAGKTYFVKQNDIETVSFEDVALPEKLTENDINSFEDIITDDTYKSGRQKEFEYILNNYRKVLTKNQLERLDQLLHAIETKQVNIDDLFHPIHNNQLNIEAIGKILFPDKDNKYRQPAVRNLLKSMRSRMDKQLQKEGFTNQENKIRSDFASFPMLEASENKKYIDYNIGSKFLRKKYYINELHIKDSESIVKFYNDEQVIPLYELVSLMTKNITVSELIKKYGINKRIAKSLNGAVYTYVPNNNGDYIINNKPYKLVDKKFVLDDGTEYKYIDQKNLKNILHNN
jgi:hypothetical protein